jgi:cytoskeletal protein RodZ
MTIEGLGKKFQDARLARGLTLDEAARLTKIRPSRLAEIEADDFSQFPSLAYAKGFLLIYGKFLDVDVTPYLDVFETSKDVTVDGYSYLQDQPAPKPRKVRPTHAPTVRRQRVRGDRTSPLPIVIGIGVIIVGFILMRLIMNIQRISPHQMVGVPQPTAAESAPSQAPVQQAPPRQAQVPQPPPAQKVPVQTPPPAQTLAPTAAPVAQAPSRAPSPPPAAVAEAPKKSAPPVATVAPSIAIPDAVVPAFANANPAAKTSAAPTKEPEVRRAEPVRPEDLAKAAATTQTTPAVQKTSEAQGPNQVAIKPLKKTYIKVVVDNESQQPAFERWISPSDGPVEFRGQKIAVRVLDRDAIQIKKNGKPVAGGDEDVTVE